ncbi:Na(+)/H(+) antiporter subunit D [Clostridium liquoris]|uniref:Na(+)/H(+) antiporter subunit D n=1 Tax=Clostridium liquoris TaxID=1289519 RepID=A0A2T0B544_9CLOT|nr:proton-conducting transporter membrane subunit [Clostridium liquoris]PRR78917.1 Na(+)/H(+) antiporter subunit D [Clostridium liquoris]
MLIDSFPLLTVLLLFITASIMPLLKKSNLVKGICIISFIVSFVMYLATLNRVLKTGDYFYRVGHFNAPFGIEFHVGTVECIMGILFTFVAIMVIWNSIYNIHFDIREDKIPLYYLLVNILIASLLGIVFSNDMFNVFVFIEIGNLASCGIVVVKDKKENIKAGMKYLIMSCLGSGLVLMGIAFLYSITGHLNMTYIHNELVKNYIHYPRTILITLGLFTVGLGVKSAMFPLHTWLPDAHSNAPTTSSAILSSLVLKGYILFLIKVLYRVFGIEIIRNFPILNIILVLGCLGMILGSIFAIFQKNLKRVIAYSTVAQMGYIFFAIGLGTELGIIMSIFHIIGHAVTKAALFLCTGAIIQGTGHKNLDELKGVGKEMPYTLGLFFIASLSMIGIPLLPGFVSKWYLALGSIEANKTLLIAVILASSLLNAVYYFPVSINGFFGEENLRGKIYKSKSKSLKELLPIIILVIAMIYIGIDSQSIINLIKTGLV